MICEGGGIQLRMEIFHFLPETHTNISTTKTVRKKSSIFIIWLWIEYLWNTDFKNGNISLSQGEKIRDIFPNKEF